MSLGLLLAADANMIACYLIVNIFRVLMNAFFSFLLSYPIERKVLLCFVGRFLGLFVKHSHFTAGQTQIAVLLEVISAQSFPP